MSIAEAQQRSRWQRVRFVAEFALLAAPAIAAPLTARLGGARLGETRLVRPLADAWASLAVGALLAVLPLAPRVADARAGRRWLGARPVTEIYTTNT